MEQRQLAPAGDEEIGPTITIIVGDGAAVRVEINAVEADLLGHVLEFEVAEVLVELARVADDLPLVRPDVGAAARDEDIEQAVAVEVDQGNAAAERFENSQVTDRLAVSLPDHDVFAVAIGDIDAGRGGDILEEGRAFNDGSSAASPR